MGGNEQITAMEVEIKQEYEGDADADANANAEGDFLDQIEILSDEQYDAPPCQGEAEVKSENSSEEYSKLGQELTEQQKFVEAKYQKYKKLRRKLQNERMNRPENRSVSDSFSSFSGSSLSSDSDDSDEEITKETIDMILLKFEKMQQPRASQSDEPITLRKIGDEHDVTIEFLEELFERWKKNQKEKARAEEKKARELSQAEHAENGSKVMLVPTESMLNAERARVIEQLITENPYITQNEIFLELNKMSQLKSLRHGKFKEISRAVVTKLLTDGPFKQTRLRVLPADRNDPKVVELRHLFCKELLKRLNRGYSVLFLDEHNFELFQSRDCMWVRPDQLNKSAQLSKKHQFSLLAVFDLLGGAFWKISSNCREKYDDYEGFQSLFGQAMELLEEHEAGLFKKEEEQSRTGRKICLVMDSQIVNSPQKLRRYQVMLGSKVLLLPQCSVQLNPIEEWFQQLRLRIRAHSYSSNEELLSGVHNLLREYQTFDYKPLVDEAINQITRGFRKDRF